MIWGDDIEYKALETQDKILCAMTDDEKNLKVKLSIDDKKGISEVTQL